MNNTVVLKFGGSSLDDVTALSQLAALIGGYRQRRYRVVVVHGGGPSINSELRKMGLQWQFINGQRQTTKEMMAVINEVLAKKVNGFLVNYLNSVGLPVIGVSAASSGILWCSRLSRELIRVGKIERVEAGPICEILSKDPSAMASNIALVAPIGRGLKGELYNINADWAAARIAIALNARKLIYLTDQDGILGHDGEPISLATPASLDKMIAQGVITGGMYTKVKTMVAALESGVGSVQVLNARQAGLLLSQTVGTQLVKQVSKTRKRDELWMNPAI